MAQTVLEEDNDPASSAARRVNTLGHLLDDAIPIPGTSIRVGIDPLLGILPVAGDTIAATISLYIVFEGIRAGVPRATLVRMLSYVAIDAVIGSIPVLGTVFDVFWKANKWNAGLLEAHAEDQSSEY